MAPNSSRSGHGTSLNGHKENLKQIFKANLDLINKIIDSLAFRWNMQPDETEEMRSEVYERIIGDEYRIFRRFESKTVLRSFLTLSIRNICHDLHRKRHGRWRPSSKSKQLGIFGIKMDELLNLRQYTVEEACELILTDYQDHQNPAPEKDELLIIASQLKTKQKSIEIHPDESHWDSFAQADATAEEELLIAEIAQKKAILDRSIESVNNTLSDEECLIFMLYFKDGCKISSIARMMNEKRHRIDLKLNQLLKTFKNQIVEAGLSDEEIKEILDYMDHLE